MLEIQRRALDLEEYHLEKSYSTNPLVKMWVSEYIYGKITIKQLFSKLINELVEQNDTLFKQINDLHMKYGIPTKIPNKCDATPYDRDRDNPFQ